jgi:N-acetylmuramoyl-L-alanine amidase
LVYRVLVLGDSEEVQEAVQTIVPGAFRTTVNGQRMMQAGVFREQGKATELQQTLSRNNLQVMVLPMKVNDISITPAPRPDSSSMLTHPFPKTGVRVVIDPGHGGGDPGAIGIAGMQEAELVLDVSHQVVSLLKQEGFDVVMTRQRDEEIDLKPRVQFADNANADVFVSIHANALSASRPDVSGVETYYYSGSEGQRLARSIQDSLLRDLNARDRGVQQANFYVIKYTSMPAALVEIGFVTGREDATRLSSASGRTRTAQAIARGISQYLRLGR